MKYVKPLQLFKQLLRTKASVRGGLLCLNVYDDFVSSAVSTPDNYSAMPLRPMPLDKNHSSSMHYEFCETISGYDLAAFVFGIKDSDDDKAKHFLAYLHRTDAGGLKDMLKYMKYTCLDNSFSSKHGEYVDKDQVELLLKHLNLLHIKPETIVDQLSAVGLLRGYLNHAWGEVYKGAKKPEAAEE